MSTYKVGYIANDGTRRSFTFESARCLVCSRSYDSIVALPLVKDVMREFVRRSNYPDNPMHLHGGAHMLTRIENVQTGNVVLFEVMAPTSTRER